MPHLYYTPKHFSIIEWGRRPFVAGPPAPVGTLRSVKPRWSVYHHNKVFVWTSKIAFVSQIVSCTPANAVANGVIASIIIGKTISCQPANAVAAGVNASITYSTVLHATPGNAVADGIQASISLGVPVTITAVPGNAVANGILATISNIPAPQVDATPRWSLNAKAVGITYTEFWDFISLMAIGETVSTATLQISLVSGTVDDSASILNGPAVPDGQRVLQSLKGGTAGQTYEIRCKVQSNLANSYTLASFLAVVPAEFA
jgi:hypothetical protein